MPTPTNLSATIAIKLDLTVPGAAEVLAELADPLGEFLKRLHTMNIPTTVLSPPNIGPDVEPPEPSPPAGTPPKRVRDRTAERRAAAEKAAAGDIAERRAANDKAAAAAGRAAASMLPGNGHAAEPDPLLDTPADAALGDPFEDDAAPLPPGTPEPVREAIPARVRTPQQAMDGALVLLRQSYSVNGGAEAVKTLQREFKVTKFKDLPLDSAIVLFDRAMAIATRLGVQIPKGI